MPHDPNSTASEEPLEPWIGPLEHTSISQGTSNTSTLNPAQPAPNFTVQIAVGVAIGILSATAVLWSYTAWRTQQALDAIAANSQQVTRAANDQMRTIAAAQQAKAAADEEAALRRTTQLAAQQRAAEADKKEKLAAQEARDFAWRKFYQQPAKCTDNPTPDTLVQCANEFIRAKRAFDSRYQPL